MLIEHRGARPVVDESAYIAPTAVLCGDVTVGPDCSVLFGAVISADGGPVTIGPGCVIMENAVIRGTPKHEARLGTRVLVGPHAHLTGCSVEDNAFLATGATVFNGAVVRVGSEVRINGIVHVNSVVAPDETVPIGWIAVGDPARFFPPSEHEAIWEIQRKMDFMGTVFAADHSVPIGEVTRRYARGLARKHRGDVVLPCDDDPGGR